MSGATMRLEIVLTIRSIRGVVLACFYFLSFYLSVYLSIYLSIYLIFIYILILILTLIFIPILILFFFLSSLNSQVSRNASRANSLCADGELVEVSRVSISYGGKGEAKQHSPAL